MSDKPKWPSDPVERALILSAAAANTATVSLQSATMMQVALIRVLIDAQVVERDAVADMFEKCAGEIEPTDPSGKYLLGIARMIRLIGTAPMTDILRTLN